MPAGAQVLWVASQPTYDSAVEEQPRDGAFMWAFVDPDAEMVLRTFYVHGTGHPVSGGRKYLGSFMLAAGYFVGHVFEDEQ